MKKWVVAFAVGASCAWPGGAAASWPIVFDRLDEYELPSDWTTAVSVGDVSADGRPDVVITGRGGTFVLAQQPDGSLKLGEPLAGALHSALGDLNGDGRSDLVLTDHLGIHVSWGGEDGLGAVEQADDQLIVDVPLIRDMNADGLQDIILTNVQEQAPDAGVFLLTQRPDRSFSVARLTEKNAGATAVGDVNADGYADLVFDAWEAGVESTGLSYLLHQPDGTYVYEPATSTRLHGSPLIVGPFGAARESMVFDAYAWKGVVGDGFWEGGGLGLYSRGNSGIQWIDSVGGDMPALAHGDLDGNGMQDVVSFYTEKNVSGNPYTDAIGFHVNRNWNEQAVIEVPRSRPGPHSLLVVDVDCNGRPDVVYGGEDTAGDGILTVIRQEGPSLEACPPLPQGRTYKPTPPPIGTHPDVTFPSPPPDADPEPGDPDPPPSDVPSQPADPAAGHDPSAPSPQPPTQQAAQPPPPEPPAAAATPTPLASIRVVLDVPSGRRLPLTVTSPRAGTGLLNVSLRRRGTRTQRLRYRLRVKAGTTRTRLVLPRRFARHVARAQAGELLVTFRWHRGGRPLAIDALNLPLARPASR